tara:strand:+ start:2463 stop:2648 length:186 start_codon:yes stop_codon:yes gene_type:complete
MIEVSLIEIALFCWAVIATAYALKYRQQEQGAKMFIRALMEDDKMRNALVKEFKEHMEEQT